MSFDVEFRGAGEALERLTGLNAQVKRAEVNAINALSTIAKREFVEDINDATGIKKSLIRKSIASSRASSRKPMAQLLPSSKRVPVTQYKYKPNLSPHPTRARIVIDYIGGEKKLAGFINPKGRKKAPLRRKGKGVRYAYGPSIASTFKLLLTGDRHSSYQKRIAELFEEKLDDQINKGA